MITLFYFSRLYLANITNPYLETIVNLDMMEKYSAEQTYG